jgi:hypothetical protein
MKRIVTIGVRKMAMPASAASSTRAVGGLAPREMIRQGMGRSQSARQRIADVPFREAFQIGKLRGSEDLDAFLREIAEEPRERETRTIDRGLTDPPIETQIRTEQFDLQRLRVAGVKLADGDGCVLGIGRRHLRFSVASGENPQKA